MDTKVAKRRSNRAVIAAGGLVTAVLLILAFYRWTPNGLRVDGADVQIGTVTQAEFADEVIVRATAEALHSTVLDAVESGRVEEVFVQDGSTVEKGQLLFRLSNPQRRLDVLQRQTEVAQQVTNLLNLRVALEASKTDHRRVLSGLEFALEQAEKRHNRNLPLAAKGLISRETVELSADDVANQRKLVDQEKESAAAEYKIRTSAVEQLQQTITALEAGLQLEMAAVDELALRAPAAGRMTDFRLNIGESVNQGQHIGRIDDPSASKLTAQIDQYYLSRISVGQKGIAQIDGQTYPVEISLVYSQIKDGRFTAQLIFKSKQPNLSPGSTVDVKLTLGESRRTLVAPNGPYYNDTSGGTWVFVVSKDGRSATRRQTRFGRRNNSQVEILSGLEAGERIVISEYSQFGRAETLLIGQ